MNKAAFIEKVRHVARTMDRVDELTEDGALERMKDGQAGQPRSPSFNAGTSTSKPPKDDDPEKPKEWLEPDLRGRDTHSDPTGLAALQSLNYGDRAANDEKAIEDIVKRMNRDATSLEAIFARYTPRTPSVIDRLTTSQDVEPGCVSCARVAGPNGPWWNPATRTTTLATGEVVLLCDWCYRTPTVGAQFTGQLPDRDEVAHYRDHGRARRRTA